MLSEKFLVALLVYSPGASKRLVADAELMIIDTFKTEREAREHVSTYAHRERIFLFEIIEEEKENE